MKARLVVPVTDMTREDWGLHWSQNAHTRAKALWFNKFEGCFHFDNCAPGAGGVFAANKDGALTPSAELRPKGDMLIVYFEKRNLPFIKVLRGRSATLRLNRLKGECYAIKIKNGDALAINGAEYFFDKSEGFRSSAGNNGFGLFEI